MACRSFAHFSKMTNDWRCLINAFRNHEIKFDFTLQHIQTIYSVLKLKLEYNKLSSLTQAKLEKQAPDFIADLKPVSLRQKLISQLKRHKKKIAVAGISLAVGYGIYRFLK